MEIWERQHLLHGTVPPSSLLKCFILFFFVSFITSSYSHPQPLHGLYLKLFFFQTILRCNYQVRFCFGIQFT